MRIFLDANILFSAAKSDGAVRALLSRLAGGGHECWIDEYVLFEARRNLERKGREALTALEVLVPRLHVGGAVTTQLAGDALEWLPAKDRPVLAAAIRLRCEAFVTGDRKHFGTAFGRVVSGVTIHSPRSLAESLLNT